MNTSLATQPTIWEDANRLAAVGDFIRKPRCPIARVIGKLDLADGRTSLVVTFPGCDRRVEEWVLPAVEVISTPVAVAIPEPVAPTATETDNLPRMQPIAKTDKKLDAIFGERVKQYRQFLIIREELESIGIKVGKLIKSRDDAKGWNLNWNGDKAGLFWSVGGDWCVESLKYDTELAGNWEGFDLMEQLECNGIDLDPSDED